MIFIDLSIPESIAEALKKVRKDVLYLYDVYPPPSRMRPGGTPDPDVPYFKLLVSTLDEMEQRFASTPRPFLYTVGATGLFTLVNLKPVS